MKFTFRLRPKAYRAELVPFILSLADPDIRARSIATATSGKGIIDHIPDDHIEHLIDAALDLLENAALTPDTLKEPSQAIDFFDGPMHHEQRSRLALLRDRRRDVGFFIRNRPAAPSAF